MPAPISSKYFIIFFNEKEYAVKKNRIVPTMQTISFCLSSLSTPSDIINRLTAHIMVRTPGKNAVFHNIFFLNTRTSSFNFVSHSPHSLDILWILRRIIHLISQMSDVNHNCIRTVHKILFSPHFLKQFFRIHNFTTILT